MHCFGRYQTWLWAILLTVAAGCSGDDGGTTPDGGETADGGIVVKDGKVSADYRRLPPP